AEFLAILSPALLGIVRVLGVSILIGIVLLQWVGIRVSSQFQEVTTSLKCVAFLALIAMCLIVPGRSYTSAGNTPLIAFSGLIIALQAVVITYGGWQSPLYFFEEDSDPARNLPRTLICGVFSGGWGLVLVHF